MNSNLCFSADFQHFSRICSKTWSFGFCGYSVIPMQRHDQHHATVRFAFWSIFWSFFDFLWKSSKNNSLSKKWPKSSISTFFGISYGSSMMVQRHRRVLTPICTFQPISSTFPEFVQKPEVWLLWLFGYSYANTWPSIMQRPVDFLKCLRFFVKIKQK